MKTSTTTTAQTADSKSLSNIRFITITALFYCPDLRIHCIY